ncbi:type IV pilus assembly protein PilM [Cyanobacterium sp. HL-69]|uniref:type IV pilus assembly protein PilM n=1 Tax=unclassified Cyanobacterium TaxID=2629879 RepID=UPI00085263ED|nr:type IV pilus assembly protein PilM [Cyanobacterium sp. IPPAS B-1200]AUC60225.1 type IV pilus assembly protein PilM [Cyanobacterium sp. HL-69]OEJ79720.1 pilus assembly protein PilM [Cyanobacterium sp. IPPAS B-1200]
MVGFLSNLLGGQGKGVGIEINPDRISLAQVSKKGQQYKLLKYQSLEVPEEIFEEGQIKDSEALAELIEQLLKEAKIKPKQVATSVPMRESIIRILPIPAELNDQELKDTVLNHEASLYLPYPKEEVDLDYQKLGYFVDDSDGIEKVQVLLVATRKENTDLYLETFQQAGMDIKVLEINSFSLIRTLKPQLQQFSASEAVVLVDIEFDSTEIAIIVEGVPQFSRTVPIGTYQMQIALAQAMNLPTSKNTEILQDITIPNNPDQTSTSSTSSQTWINPGMDSLLRVLGELVDELRRSVNFYINQSGDVEVVQILIAGPGAGLAQIDEFFTKKLNIPATLFDPVTSLGITMKEELSGMERYGLGTVLGLAMRMN